MNDPALLKTLITRGQAAIGERKLVARDVKLPRAAGKLLTITGIRRCGKSSVMRLQAEALVKKGVDWRHIVFLNLEDDRLEPSHTTLDQILRAYRELHPEVPLSKVH
ncbi:MAG TPA: AAA family ATPase, partial [Flavobacteriales bacterium]|nr:AAA family ATPase [Flavobacteriales bacterium]